MVSVVSKEKQTLVNGMVSMGLDIDDTVVDQLLEYTAHLKKWNRTYNLVSGSDLAQFETRHLLDSLSIHSYLQSGSLLDVGTGAGLPGLPLACVMPELECTLLDSAGKKIRFLRHVKRSMGLPNMHLVESRVSGFEFEGGFDHIVSRAFSSVGDFAEAVRHLCKPGTRLIAMKGKQPADELQVLPDWLNLLSVEKISIQGLHAERHLVIMCVSE
jgi:16S rRNA (guanine527-N7)-methyltransferase